MSVHDERDLRAQLAGLLDGVEARPAPVAATIDRGRRIRVRRWISAVVGLAVVAALAAAVPAALNSRPHSAGLLAPAHYSVKVAKLGPIARGGVIAQGVTDGRRWKVVGNPYRPPDVHGRGGNASAGIHAVGAGRGVYFLMNLFNSVPPDPVSLSAGWSGPFTTLVGSVGQQVTSVVLQLPNGDRPSLTPVSWGGDRLVAVVIPTGVPVIRAVAYAGTRELAYSVPFRGTDFATWWEPGQVGPARLTKSIGSGVIDGKRWQATASIGPWGWCFFDDGAGSCSGVAPKAELEGKAVRMLVCSPATDQEPASGLVYTASDVTRVVLRFSDGRSATFRPVEVAGIWISGYAVPAHVQVTTTREYGSRRQIIGSQAGNAIGYPGWSCAG